MVETILTIGCLLVLGCAIVFCWGVYADHCGTPHPRPSAPDNISDGYCPGMHVWKTPKF